jgi:hypothetical protein
MQCIIGDVLHSIAAMHVIGTAERPASRKKRFAWMRKSLAKEDCNLAALP